MTEMTTRDPGVATGIGVIAILLWSGLALLTALAAAIPPFEMLALSFGVAFIASLALLARHGRAGFSRWRQPWQAWLTGFLGIFVYHALYFYALKAAAPAEASLIAYLWPLFIVLFSALAAREKLQLRQMAGACLGLSGTALILFGRAPGAPGSNPLFGYGAALICALVWSSYSVVNRRFRDVPSDVIGGICGLVALAGALCHALFEPTVMPDPVGWVAIVGLGLGPVGVAFFAWDLATKYGRLPVLGALSYLAPLLSTLWLILSGQAQARPSLLAASLLIMLGSAVATLRRRAASPSL